MSGRRKILARLGALAIGGVLMLGCAEVGLRLFPGWMSEDTRLRLHWRELVADGTKSVADPYIGFVYPPYAANEFARDDLQFSYTTDAHGFRNEDPWPERADIVAVGDSLTFGYGAEDDGAYPRVLGEAWPQWKVLNLGLIGAAPQQSARVYERYGVPLEPKVLLFGLFLANDLYDGRKFAEWLAEGSPGNYDVWRFAGSNADARRSLRQVLRDTYVARFAEESLRRLRARNARYSGKTHTFPDGGRLQFAPGLLDDAARGAQPGHADFERVMTSLQQAQDMAAEHGTEMIVVFIPSKEEVYLPLLDAPCPDPIAPVRAACEQRGWRAFDLTPGLRVVAERSQRLYFEVDGHLNPQGYALAAELVGRHLDEHAEELGLSR